MIIKNTLRDSTTKYTGRTVDLLLLKTVTSPGSDIVVKTDISGKPMMTTGIEKLVQRYAQIFLTNIGSVKNQESLGTEFLKQLGLGHIYNDSTLRKEAAAANFATTTQIRDEDSVLDTPDDEMLATADVVEAYTERSTATVYVKIKITTVAGDSFIYVTPITAGI